MSWTTADIPDLTDRVAVVTGANGGLGLESARALAGAGAHVVMAARNQAKAAGARVDVLGTHPRASLEIVELDLGSQASVERAAATVLDRHDRLDVLLNNAGLMAMPEGTTEDGFETQWGVNVLGHWTLTARLLPLLVTTPGARIVTVSSTAQYIGAAQGGIHDDPHLRGGAYEPWKAYGQSKLGNRLFAVGLQRQFENVGVDAASFVAHPGLSATDLQQRTHREQGGALSAFAARWTPTIGMEPADGARSQLRAATDPGADPHLQYAPLWVNSGPPVGKPMLRTYDAEVRKLWRLAAADTGVPLDVRDALDAAA